MFLVVVLEVLIKYMIVLLLLYPYPYQECQNHDKGVLYEDSLFMVLEGATKLEGATTRS